LGGKRSAARSGFRNAAKIVGLKSANLLPLFRAAELLKRITEEPTRPQFFGMSASNSGMCEAQRIDLKLAIEGRITWQQYFAMWGAPSP
jgi:hypothetical protein